MNQQPVPICGTHKTQKEWQPTTFVYQDEDISVIVPDVYAWICPEGGEVSFTPETTDELIETVHELFEAAKLRSSIAQ